MEEQELKGEVGEGQTGNDIEESWSAPSGTRGLSLNWEP